MLSNLEDVYIMNRISQHSVNILDNIDIVV
jgi:hypothetical protein